MLFIKFIDTNEPDMNQSNQTESEEIQNDEVVGSAIKWSLGVFLVLVAAGILIWLLTKKPPELVAEKAGPTELPTERVKPSLEIPEVLFTEITEQAGIDFVHENGADGEKLLPETMGGGGAFLDFDNDGDQDLLCINSNIWPWAKQQPEKQPTSALYANDGTGKFSSVTAGSGLDVALYGNGVACGDFDNDNDVDVFISCLGLNHLFRNDGGGKFSDITTESGVGGSETEWSTSCGWFDYDNDGDLDLFVANYIQWSRELDVSMEFTLDGALRAYGRPTDFTGAFPYLYRNEGAGRFTDVSEQSGVQVRDPNTKVPASKSLGVTFCDVNADGRLDIIVANDTVQNLLFVSQADGTFLESAATAGVAFQGIPGQRASTQNSVPGAMDGQAIWMKVPSGNGVFNVAPNGANTGAVWTDTGQVVNPGAVTGDNYTIAFTVAAGVTTYSVTNTTTATTVATGQPFVSGQAIAFDGLSMVVNGTPQNADAVQVSPSTTLDMFKVMDDAISGIRNATTGSTASQAVATALTQIDSGMDRLQAAQGQAGEWLNRADTIADAQKRQTVQLEADRVRAEDLDMVKGISDFQKIQTGYQAALQSYASVQKMSLFNFIN